MGRPPPAPPTGIVTVMFTDVDGTTADDRSNPAFRGALGIYDRVVRGVCTATGGYVVGVEGDSFLVVFQDPAAAVQASIEIQEGLSRAAWPHAVLAAPTTAPGVRGLPVRIGVHRGSIETRTIGDRTLYAGPEVLRAARLTEAAQGGQVLVTKTTWDASSGAEAIVRDLGPHRLPGEERAIHLMEIVPPSLPHRRLPPPRTLGDGSTNLPRTPPTFVGRAAEEATVAEAVARHQLLNLHGPEGIGKTRLAQRFGSMQLQIYAPAGGAWSVDLARARNVDEMVWAVVNTIGLRLDRSGAVAPQLRERLGGRGDTLLILDSPDRIAPEVEELVREWAHAAPDAQFLVLSHERIGTLPALQIGPLEPGEGLALLVERSLQVNPQVDLGEGEIEAARDIAARMRHIPLALEMAAVRVRTLKLSQLQQRIAKRFPLAAGAPTSAGHQATVAAAIDWAYSLSSKAEQIALAQCSVFRGGFTRRGGEAVVEVPDAASGELLDALLGRGLLQWSWSDAEEPRLSLHSAVARHAADRLTRLGAEEPLTQRRHGRYYAAYGDEGTRESAEVRGDRGRILLAAELDNLMAALHRAIAADEAATAVRAVTAVVEVLLHQRRTTAALRVTQHILQMRSLEPQYRLRALYVHGRACHVDDRPEEATRALGEAIRLAVAVGDRGSGALLHLARGNVHRDAGDLSAAAEDYRTALEVFRDVDRNRASQALIGLGRVMLRRGRAADARALIAEALALHEQGGDRREQANALVLLAHADTRDGKFDHAEKRYTAAIQRFTHLGSRRAEAIARRDLGLLHRQVGRRGEAKTELETALSLFRELGDAHAEADVHRVLAELAREIGRIDDARRHLEEAVRAYRRGGDANQAVGVMYHLGEVLRQHGAPRAAVHVFEDALALAEASGDPGKRAALHTSLAIVDLQLGQLGAAREQLSAALALHADALDPASEGRTYGVLAALSVREGNFVAARHNAQRAEALLTQGGVTVHKAVVVCQLGQIELASGNRAAAVTALAQATAMANQLGVGADSPLAKAIQRLRRAAERGTR